MRNTIILSAILIAGCQSAGDAEMPAAEPMIPSLSEHATMAAAAWNTTWSAGDGVGIGDQYADDAVVYPPNSDPIVGKAAITEFWSGVMAAGVGVRIESVESSNNGALGYEVGSYVSEDSTGAHLDHGDYLLTWKYVDGSWKIFRDMWSTNMPAPGM